jgi:flagellin
MSLLRINSDTERVLAQRNVARADAGVARAVERLSSGFRINRASDDASGLTISEHLRAQVRGFAQDQRNIQDAIALAQTGDGALADEVISMARGQILSQAGTSLLAQANQANQGVLTLIR